MIKKYLIPLMMTMVASLLCSLDKADASAIRLNPGFGTNVLPGNDDGSTRLDRSDSMSTSSDWLHPAFT